MSPALARIVPILYVPTHALVDNIGQMARVIPAPPVEGVPMSPALARIVPILYVPTHALVDNIGLMARVMTAPPVKRDPL